jgi:hypothetical protein
MPKVVTRKSNWKERNTALSSSHIYGLQNPQQLLRSYPQSELSKRSKRMFSLTNAINHAIKLSLNLLKMTDIVIPPNQDAVFLINLNHGVIPLKYVGEMDKNPVKIIEYISNVDQVKVIKAPIAACPFSTEDMHLDLINKLKRLVNSRNITTNDDLNKKITSLISDRTLPENNDALISINEYVTGDRGPIEIQIGKHVDKTYQTINIQSGTPTANKYFFMNKSERDGDIYILKQATIILPFTSTIIQIPLQRLAIPPPSGYLYSAGDIPFVSTSEITIKDKDGVETTYAAGTSVLLKMDMFIKYDAANVQRHIADMGIKSIFISNDYYKLYPYSTGIKVGEQSVMYEPFTGILSCPYFIEYFQQMISTNKSTTSKIGIFAEEHVDSNFITPCTSLLYPHEHETVFGLNSLLLTNYFRNSKCVYSYDFTCQALELVDIAPNRQNYNSYEDLSRILFDHKGNQKMLYSYARGISKKTKKRTNKKRITRKKRYQK